MDKMRFGQTIALVGLISFLLAGFSVPTSYAVEDGQFPAFPTVIEVSSPQADSAPLANSPQAEPAENEDIATSKIEVSSPWDLVKRLFGSRARAGEESVVFALEALDAKPSRQGDLRYQISYANNTGETLRRASLQVFLPKELQYLDSDVRPHSKENGAVVYEIGKIAAGEGGVIQLETRLKKKKAKEIILSATMAYEDINGGRHTVTAATNSAFNGKTGGGLSASVLGGAGGFILWLFVIILIIALVFVAYQYFILQASGRRV